MVQANGRKLLVDVVARQRRGILLFSCSLFLFRANLRNHQRIGGNVAEQCGRNSPQASVLRLGSLDRSEGLLVYQHFMPASLDEASSQVLV